MEKEEEKALLERMKIDILDKSHSFSPYYLQLLKNIVNISNRYELEYVESQFLLYCCRHIDKISNVIITDNNEPATEEYICEKLLISKENIITYLVSLSRKKIIIKFYDDDFKNYKLIVNQNIYKESKKLTLNLHYLFTLKKYKKYIATGFIYFIFDNKNNAIKIGYSKNCAKRLLQLKTGNSEELTIIGYICGSYGVENRIHKELKDHNINREWFSYDEEVKLYINNLLNNGGK